MAFVSVTAALMPDEAPREPQTIPPLVGEPGAAGTHGGETVVFDAFTGRAVYQTYVAQMTQAWRQEPGLVGSILRDEPAQGVRTMAVAQDVAEVPPDVYAGSASLALAALALLAASRLVAGFVVLYTRLARGDLTRHPRRARILETLAARPGLSVAQLREAVGVGGGALRHHLAVLERSGFLARVEVAGDARHFLSGSSPQRRLVLEAVLQAGGAEARALRRLQETPGIHVAALARALGVTRAAAHLTARRLVQRGLVRLERVGRQARLFPVDAAE